MLLFSFALLYCYMIVFIFGLISVLVYCHAFESCKAPMFTLVLLVYFFRFCFVIHTLYLVASNKLDWIGLDWMKELSTPELDTGRSIRGYSVNNF